MWELIAPIVRWPLYSPQRLLTILALALAVVFVAGELNGDDTAPTAEPAPTVSASPEPSVVPAYPVATPPTSTPTTSPSAAPAVRDHVEEGATDALSVDPAADNPTAAAADAAAAFVSAWARPDLSREAWAAGVQPLATPELWTEGLGETDPANTPAITVTGEPVQVAINAEEGVFDVPTTGAWVRVHVAYVGESDRWLASRVEPAA